MGMIRNHVAIVLAVFYIAEDFRPKLDIAYDASLHRLETVTDMRQGRSLMTYME